MFRTLDLKTITSEESQFSTRLASREVSVLVRIHTTLILNISNHHPLYLLSLDSPVLTPSI